MSKHVKVLAFDFGASSGRAMLCEFDGTKISLTEIHRFKNGAVQVSGQLYWDALGLFSEIKTGLLKVKSAGHGDIAAIGIDTWGVDYGLLDQNGKLLGNPYHYRDQRTDGLMDEVDKDYVYERTGIQFAWFNTIFQLLAEQRDNPHILGITHQFLLMPDLFNYLLTGQKYAEYSIASTTQLLNPKTQSWDFELIDKLGLPKEIFPPVIDSGTQIGVLSQEVCEELDLPPIPVVAVTSHDTASAVVSVPMVKGEKCAYISCGTWSLMGIESDEPIINEKSFHANFTNEGGINRSVRFLKNIMGLWLIQECKRQWESEGDDVSFAELEDMARASKPFACFIDPDYHTFQTPGNMPKRIREFCRQTGQVVPQTKGEVVRAIAESLALKYNATVEQIEAITGEPIETIRMVGGGIKDTFLCQLTADATGRRVYAGPVEATATGNAMVQLISLGEVTDLAEARKIVDVSFPMVTYHSQNHAEWVKMYEVFAKYCG